MFVLLALLGMGHESPLQQHEADLSLPLQHACAFLPLRFFLQQVIAASLQQFAMSQHAEVLELLFCGVTVKAAAETVSAAQHARPTTRALILLILRSPGLRIRRGFEREGEVAVTTATGFVWQADF